MERLNVRAVTIEAFGRYRLHFADLLKVVTLPALAYTTVLFVSRRVLETPDLILWIGCLVMLLIASIAALSCHRVMLLGSGSLPRLGVNGRQSRDWKFVGACLLLFLIYYGLMFVIYDFVLERVQSLVIERVGRQSLIVSLSAWLAPLYVLSRLALLLPAVSVDRPHFLQDAWRLSRHNGLRLLLLVGLPPWAMYVAQQAVAGLFAAHAAFLSVEAVLFWLLFPLEIALLSTAYQKLSEWAA